MAYKSRGGIPVYRKVCAWHQKYPAVPNPQSVPLPTEVRCPVPDCHRQRHLRPGGKRDPYCAKHSWLDDPIPPPAVINPYIGRILVEQRRAKQRIFSPQECADFGIWYNTKTKMYDFFPDRRTRRPMKAKKVRR